VGVLTTVALALAATRLVLVWHWPSDVLGGLALGAAMACVARAGWALTPAALRWLRAAARGQPP
jgi:membrane-associated phospholipid phosphatase